MSNSQQIDEPEQLDNQFKPTHEPRKQPHETILLKIKNLKGEKTIKQSRGKKNHSRMELHQNPKKIEGIMDKPFIVLLPRTIGQ